MEDDSSPSPLAADGPELINVLERHRAGLNAACYSPSGDGMVTGGDGGSMIFWNVGKDSEKKTGFCYKLNNHLDAINYIDFAPNGRFFISASKDCTARLWTVNSDASHHRPLASPSVYNCHARNIRSVCISPESNLFCSSSDDQTVKLWDANHRNKFIKSLVGHNNWVRAAKFCPRNSSLIASTGDDGVVLIHDLRCEAMSFPVSSVRVGRSRTATHCTSLEFYPLSDFIVAVGATDSSVRLYDIRMKDQGQQCLQYFSNHSASVTSVSFHPSGQYLLSSSADHSLRIYDIVGGHDLYEISCSSSPVNCAKFDGSGEQFVSVGADKIVYVWKSNLITSDSDDSGTEDDTMFSSAPNLFSRGDYEPTFQKRGKSSSSTPHLDSVEHPRRAFTESPDVASYGPSVRRCSSSSWISEPDITTKSKEDHPTSEMKLLQGIVSQISLLSDSIAKIDARLSVVEKLTINDDTRK